MLSTIYRAAAVRRARRLYREARALREAVVSVSLVDDYGDMDYGRVCRNHALIDRLQAREDRRSNAWVMLL